MALNSFQANQGTQTRILTDNTGGESGTVIAVQKVDISAQGTAGTLWDGKTQGGTINRVEGGSIVVTAGTVNVGTITTLIDNIDGGTINNIGTVVGLGSVSGVAQVHNAGTVQTVIPGTLATNLGKQEDGAHASGDVGVMALGVIKTDNTAVAAEGDYAHISLSSRGNIQPAQYADSTPSSLILDTDTGGLLSGGDVAHDGIDAGRPVKIGGKASSSVPTSVANADRVNAYFDVSGRQAIFDGGLEWGTVNKVGTVPGVGVITSITNLVGGTTTRLEQGSINVTTGTVNAGTINIGTFKDDGRAGRNILTYGTQVTGTAAIAATIIGSASVGAGTSLWLQDVSITNNNANVLCVLGFGTAQQGTNVLLRHNLGTSGAVGIEKPFGKPVNAGMTNQDLVFSLGAAGTIDLTFSYFISA